MALALGLARAQLGRTAPNPAVGCLIVREGRIVGAGATGDGGRPHAEELALAAASAQAASATAYVTLEPCSARSNGAPSCAQRLIAAKPTRIVIACEEPNPTASGGLAQLQAAGLTADLGVLREQAFELNRGFFKRLRTGRPWLGIASGPSGFDAEFDLLRGESFEAALDRLGAAGLTRVFVRAGGPLAAQLAARGLIDEQGG